MSVLDIVYYPNPNLRKKSVKIEDPTAPEVKDLVLDMVRTMEEYNGIGLAAPQVGLSQNIIVIETEDGPLPLINPQIIKKSWKKELGEEGCLSIPGVFGLVNRPRKIKVKALTHHGKEISFNAEDLFARVIQHEIDHLDGILFIDKATKIIKGDLKALEGAPMEKEEESKK